MKAKGSKKDAGKPPRRLSAPKRTVTARIVLGYAVKFSVTTNLGSANYANVSDAKLDAWKWAQIHGQPIPNVYRIEAILVSENGN